MLDEIPIHIINLLSRSDRKAKLIDELNKHNIKNYTFTEATHGSDLNIQKMLDSNLISYQNRRLTAGECGCYLSHVKVLEFILSSPYEMHLILEDDVYFVNAFGYKFNKVLSKTKGFEWDIFYIGINHEFNSHQGVFIGKKSDGIYYPTAASWGTHAYLVRKSNVQKILEFLKAPILWPIDVALMHYTELVKLTLINPIIKVYNSDSDTRGII